MTCAPKTIVNIYTVYKITKNNPISSCPTCFFGAVKLTKNTDIGKYKYSAYGIEFDRRRKFSFGDGFGQNVIIFRADASTSVHANNKKKYSNPW